MTHVPARLRRRTAPVLWLALAPLGFLAAFFVYPLGALLAAAFEPGGRFAAGGAAQFDLAYTLETFAFTLAQALASTVLTLALALPGAFVVVRYRFPGKRLLVALATLPFVLPTVVVAAAFTALLGARGVVNSVLMGWFGLDAPPLQVERTLWIILLAHVFYNYAVALRLISTYWAAQRERLDEAARVLGAAGWRLWLYVRLPLLRPALLAAGALVFIFTFTSFGVVLILGGVRFATLEVEIYRQALDLFNLPTAAALSLVQIGFMFVVMFAYTRLGQATGTIGAAGAFERPPRTPREHLLIVGNVGVMLALVVAPLLALVGRALTVGVDAPGFDNFARLASSPRGSTLFVPPLIAVGNSLVFALVAALLATLLGTLAAWAVVRGRGRGAALLDALFMLPLATSAVTLGLGMLVAPLFAATGLRASPVLIPLAHTLVALPFVVRSVVPALRAVPPNLPAAARVLGASGWGVAWRVELPLVARSLAVGAAYAFTISIGEFGASLFIARPDTPTLPIVIFRLLGQPGAANYGAALALSVVLMGVCALGFALVTLLQPRQSTLF